jgi:hypothetical protein
LIRKLEAKRLVRPGYRVEDNNGISLRAIGNEDKEWKYVAQSRGRFDNWLRLWTS